MASRIPNASRSAGLDALLARFNAGAGPGKVQLRSGAQPADPDDAATGTLLATITLSDPAFDAAVDGVAAVDITPALTVAAAVTGTVGWFRGLDSNDNSVIDGSVTATGGGGNLELNNTALVATIPVSITSWVVTFPAT